MTMNILFCTHDIDSGGAARSMFILISTLITMGHHIKVMSLHEPDLQKSCIHELINKGIPVFLFKWPWITNEFNKLHIDVGYQKNYRKISARYVPQIKVMADEADLVCFNGYPSTSLASLFEKRPRVLIAREQLDEKSPRFPHVARYLRHFLEYAIAIGPVESAQLSRMGIANEIVFNAAPSLPELSPLPPLNTIRFGMFGQLHELKGQHLTISACKIAENVLRMHGASFHIFGGAPQGRKAGVFEQALCAAITQYGIEDIVKMEGWTDNPSSYMKEMHCIVRVSIDGSPWGRDVIEAMSLGRPLLASGDVDIFVKPGVTGWLIPPNDAVALAKALEVLVRHPTSLPAYAHRAYDFAVENFDPNRNGAKIANIFSRLITLKTQDKVKNI